MSESCRLDKWLWAVRLYKTRSLATKACQAGKIKRAQKALKPSASLQIGDHLDVTVPENTHVRHIEVVQLLETRVSAPLAREAIIDHTSADVLKEVEEKRKILREERLFRQEGDQGRMTKKKRREWNKSRDTPHNPFFGDEG
ncbi:RNA-binding S4 domain-containing protein [Roseibacillus persicicus]|uniref:RNA-binding protein S4 n=1 Tax=Roseibacillus persicicus TaxID=454148 RepID=A0A918WKI3_9BACT|nr:S4 domain-containing protein [Roseibacillus persicicus]MDQ8190785.1 S4 domain-containing protein [Roseibacillus persicicus]GHC54003.1 RNA-binding protein S4 [Roseibacillus persicicus]